MAGNSNLAAAKNAKNDEFYTRLTDIEKEMRYYRKHFKGKTVLCNCDDPFESNFFKYFVLNFNRLGLKKLITTCYATSPIMGSQLKYHMDNTGQMCFSFDEELVADYNAKRPYKAVVTTVHDTTGDGGVDMFDVAELFKSGDNQLTMLEGNGDFRSQECLDLLDEADVVVTNPPFSIFREYVAVLLEHNKSFVIIGHMNALKYKEMFPLLKENKIWLGNKSLSGGMDMIVPKRIFDPTKVKKYYLDEDRNYIVNIMGVCWYTNLDIKKRHEEMILVKRYDEDLYPSYINFDGIDISSVVNIPCDYAGNMGVPITFMEHFNPEQFELIGTSTGELGRSIGVKPNYRGRTDVSYLKPNGEPTCPYQRFIIRNKYPEPPKGEQK